MLHLSGKFHKARLSEKRRRFVSRRFSALASFGTLPIDIPDVDPGLGHELELVVLVLAAKHDHGPDAGADEHLRALPTRLGIDVRRRSLERDAAGLETAKQGRFLRVHAPAVILGAGADLLALADAAALLITLTGAPIAAPADHVLVLHDDAAEAPGGA